MTRRFTGLALLVVIAWLVLGGVGGPLVGALSGLQKNDQASFLPVDAESRRAAEQAEAFTSGQGLPFLVVVTRSSGEALSEEDINGVRRLAISVPDLTVPADESKHLRDLLRAPYGVLIPSQDKHAVLVPVTADAQVVAGKVGDVSGAEAVAEGLRAGAGAKLSSSDLRVQVSGPGGLVADVGRAFAGIDGVLLVVALSVVLVILLLVYRSPVLPVVVLASAVVGLAAAAAVIYPLAQSGRIGVTGQSQGILSILVVGAATDYALLVVARYREELHQYESCWDAMRAAWRGTVEPVLASAATVVLALLCLMGAQLGGTRGLGPISALGILGALAAATTFLPAVLVLGGRRVFWPRIPRVDHVRSDEVSSRSGLWARVARRVTARPRLVWVVVTVGLLLAAAWAPTFRAEGLSQSQMFRTSVESVEGAATIREHFPGGTGQPALLVVPQEKTGAVGDAVRAIAGVGAVGVLSPPPEARPGRPPLDMMPPVVLDGKVLMQVTLTDQADSPAAQDTVRQIRDVVHRVDSGLAVGGQSAVTVDVRAAGERDLAVMIPAILAVVFVVLMVLLRSLVASVLLVVANLLSFAATLGIGELVFRHVFDFPGADPVTPLYAFVFLVALGVDYSIFLMTRIREETPRRGTRAATAVGVAVTGGVITSAGVVLAATFSALLVIPLVFMAQIAFLVAFGVLLDTFVVRSLLVPGLVYELAGRTWWPSRWDRVTSR
ncbi:Apo-petrobactin exporter [Austwickia sp. TVS 96-490-7B]|uniref:MMPL family transporter n=1 Tax=Austwickia sp. TVS 96-490-7B TaxID=2830843 RepID=UPI001C591C8B|nr:MMPL family transporter [Austwickia sp. TVS 96-490-7B]MBW3086903.1 Apo-petrobactin exporter [Austwickia sp. TVS 96-490-7B]